MANPNWLPAKNVRITVNATTYAIQEGTYGETVGEWDATNLGGASNAQGLLAMEHGVDTVETMLNFTFVIDGLNIVNLKAGGPLVAASYVGADGETNTGQWRCLKRSKPIATKGGFRIACEGKFSGVVSGQ